MSLDLSLRAMRFTYVYDGNITHNLVPMAAAAGLYEVLWRPEENGLRYAVELIVPLREGLQRLRDDPEKYKAMDSPNGWGTYGDFVNFVSRYLAACEANPDAEIYAWH